MLCVCVCVCAQRACSLFPQLIAACRSDSKVVQIPIVSTSDVCDRDAMHMHRKQETNRVGKVGRTTAGFIAESTSIMYGTCWASQLLTPWSGPGFENAKEFFPLPFFSFAWGPRLSGVLTYMLCGLMLCAECPVCAGYARRRSVCRHVCMRHVNNVARVSVCR